MSLHSRSTGRERHRSTTRPNNRARRHEAVCGLFDSLTSVPSRTRLSQTICPPFIFIYQTPPLFAESSQQKIPSIKGTEYEISRYHPICPQIGHLSKAVNGCQPTSPTRQRLTLLALSFRLGAPGRVLEGPLASAYSAADSLGPVPSVLLPFTAFRAIYPLCSVELRLAKYNQICQ